MRTELATLHPKVWFWQKFESEWKENEITDLQYKEIQNMQCILGNLMFFYLTSALNKRAEADWVWGLRIT